MEKEGAEVKDIGSERHARAEEFKLSGNDKYYKKNYKGAIVDYRKVESNAEKEMAFQSIETEIAFDEKKSNRGKQTDSFLEMCKDLTRDPDLPNLVSEFKDNLRSGSEAFLSSNHRKAVECYKAAKERVGIKFTDYEIDDRQYHVIEYAHCAALINTGSYGEIVKAIQSLMEMENYKFTIPALYIQIARAYCSLNRFKSALEPLQNLQDVLDNCPIFPTLTWPGTTDTIHENTPTGLKDAIKELNQTCRMSHKPTAVCRFDNCLKISTHILPSELIYNSDPDFAGYVRMICEEKCNVEFHVSCWKFYKESLSNGEKINDKDLLGKRCLTTDCVNSDAKPSLVIIIEIVGHDRQVKSINKLGPKTTVDSKKARKKKHKLDDKEKALKSKKPKEKRIREVKKSAVVAEEEEEPMRVINEPVKDLQSCKQSLEELRAVNFGMENKWNPKLPYFGRPEECVKALSGQFLEEVDELVEIKAAKDFVFSYFIPILKDEGPLTLLEIEDLWKNSVGDFFDISMVLPNFKSICELLTESTQFCQLDDYICLAEQLDKTYDIIQMEVCDVVNFLITGPPSAPEGDQQLTSNNRSPDISTHPSSSTRQSSSEDESDSDKDDSEESEEEGSGVDDGSARFLDPPETFESACASVNDEFPIIDPPKSIEDEKFSLQDMLAEMSRMKNFFMRSEERKSSEILEEEHCASKYKISDSTSTDNFETAHTNSANATDDTKYNLTDISVSGSFDEEFKNEAVPTVSSKCESYDSEDSADKIPNEKSELENLSNNECLEIAHSTCMEAQNPQLQEATQVEENINPSDHQDLTENCQSVITDSGITTVERDMQTSPLETTDKILYIELTTKLEELTNQLAIMAQKNLTLTETVSKEEEVNKQMKSEHDRALACLKEENVKTVKMHKFQQEQIRTEFLKKEQAFKNNEQKLNASVTKLKNMLHELTAENGKLKVEKNTLSQNAAELKESLTTALTSINEFEVNYKMMEHSMATKLQNSQLSQLQTIKTFLETQVHLLRKRCVEKISETQSWLSMLPPEEVENVPSLYLISQNTMQWSEISKRIQQIEATFQVRYVEIESKIARGKDVEELSLMILPALPEEPTPLSLKKIHREITEKILKKIGDLTLLVANQQLEIEKSKEANQQVQQLMNSYQVPRMQTPMTTAFGGLALQYSYPTALTHPFGQTHIPSISHPTQNTAEVGNTTKMLHTDVHTLLQESLNTAKSAYTAPAKSMKDETMRTQSPSLDLSFLNPSLVERDPIVTMPNLALSTPTMSGAPSFSTISEKKDERPIQQPSTPNVGPSQEQSPAPAPTPEKPRKKKKASSKSESQEVDSRAATPAQMAVPGNNHENYDEDPWSVVTKFTKTKPSAQVVFPVTESNKLKNKKKLLEKLQTRLPTSSLKDLEDILKLVREQNNGFLSGLPFSEIETRVRRFISQRHYQKTLPP